MSRAVRIVKKGVCDYETTHAQMLAYTVSRTADSGDEIWVLEHSPVFTQGTSCKESPSGPGRDIPLIHSDRGGQITYHGPGQLICYLLLDIKRLGLGPKALVNKTEQALISMLADYAITANRRPGAPGVYVEGEKIAALGFRIKNGRCYHGLSLNVDMDLGPFSWINPCGYPEQRVTQMKSLVRTNITPPVIDVVSEQLLNYLCLQFGVIREDRVSVG